MIPPGPASHTHDTFKCQLWVAGTPIPQGSKSVDRRNGYTFDANKNLRPWRKHVATTVAAWRAQTDHETYTTPVAAQLTFVFDRPKGHYRTGRFSHLLRDSAPRFHGVKPDMDKLERALYDALTTAQLWRDDSLVCHATIDKRYARDDETPGVHIQVWPADRPG